MEKDRTVEQNTNSNTYLNLFNREVHKNDRVDKCLEKKKIKNKISNENRRQSMIVKRCEDMERTRFHTLHLVQYESSIS